MKKIREIPTNWDKSIIQTAQYQEHLRVMVAEKGQKSIALAFTDGKPDYGFTLGDLEYQILRAESKPISPNWGTKHSIWEEGEEVCYAYGILTMRGLLRWDLHSVAEGTWLLPSLTDTGKGIVEAPENDPYQFGDEFMAADQHQ